MNQPAPALDLDDFRARGKALSDERERARVEAVAKGIEAAEADHLYRKNKALRIVHYRNEGKGFGEAEILAEGDDVVGLHRQERDIAQVLSRSGWARVDQMERNAANLRKEADMSDGLN